MDEGAFGAISGINPDGTANFGDGNVFVSFFRGSRLHRAKSQAAGMPVYDAVDMIKIVKPGERDEIHRLAEEFDKVRYRRQWEAYKSDIELAVSGTPMSTLLPANPELVDQLRALKIVTVQQLAELPDSGLTHLQFGLELRRKAQRYLAVVEKGAEFHKLEARIEAQALELKALQAKLDMAAAVPVPPKSAPVAETQLALPLAPEPATDTPKPPSLLWDDEEEVPELKTRRGRKA